MNNFTKYVWFIDPINSRFVYYSEPDDINSLKDLKVQFEQGNEIADCSDKYKFVRNVDFKTRTNTKDKVIFQGRNTVSEFCPSKELC